MKISPASSSPIEQAPARTEPASTKAVTADKVSVGSTTQVQDAKAAAQASRAAKVQQIAAQVQAGTYTVDPSKVASAIVDSDSFDRQIQGAVSGT